MFVDLIKFKYRFLIRKLSLPVTGQEVSNLCKLVSTRGSPRNISVSFFIFISLSSLARSRGLSSCSNFSCRSTATNLCYGESKFHHLTTHISFPKCQDKVIDALRQEYFVSIQIIIVLSSSISVLV